MEAALYEWYKSFFKYMVDYSLWRSLTIFLNVITDGSFPDLMILRANLGYRVNINLFIL